MKSLEQWVQVLCPGGAPVKGAMPMDDREAMPMVVEPTEEERAEPPFEAWVLAELFGHRSVAGRASEAVVAGVKFVRLEVPEAEIGGGFRSTHLYSPKAFYGITPVDEATARATANPVSHFYSPDDDDDDLPW